MRRIVILAVLIAGLIGCFQNHHQGDFALERKEMVQSQIERRGVSDPLVLKAIEKVPRHLFVDEADQSAAYGDHPLGIGYGQTISQPYIVAFMTEAAGLQEDDQVLEIGTGSGYQAAVLSRIVDQVYTIEIIPELAQQAKKRLRDLGYENIEVRQGDGYQGWPKQAPFDAVIVTAAPPKLPQELISQLKTGGRMIIPVGDFYQELIRIVKTQEGYEKEKLLPVRFVPMVRGKDKRE